MCVCEDVTWMCQRFQAKELPEMFCFRSVSFVYWEDPFPCSVYLWSPLFLLALSKAFARKKSTQQHCESWHICYLCKGSSEALPASQGSGNTAWKSRLGCNTKTQFLEETLSGKSGNTLQLPVHFITPCGDHLKEGWWLRIKFLTLRNASKVGIVCCATLHSSQVETVKRNCSFSGKINLSWIVQIYVLAVLAELTSARTKPLEKKI